MSKRVNIVLPDQTLAILARVAPRGNRSQLISRAVLYYVQSLGKQTLRERLKQEALSNAGRDVEMAADWFPVEADSSVGVAGTAKRQKGPKG